MLLIERTCDAALPASERLVLSFDARCKSRLRTRLESGEEVGIFLEAGGVMRGGDKLQGSDGRIVEVIAAPECLMEVRSTSPQALVRFAYHLGNRHVTVEIGDGWLRFAADHVLRDMLAGLGAEVAEVLAPFEPEAGAYGHRHSHHTHGGPSKIHEYGSDQ